ncbi:MAG TPA: ABC transporter ATP-binding protein [Terriglobales bacterium]|nr:ABC transporter ATP-binding protein [Terriglobales bacterium]
MGSTGMMSAWRMLGQDASVTKQKIKKGTTRRTLQFARPYAGLLCLFLVVVVADAGVGIVNPLLYRAIINNGILKGSVDVVVRLALLMGGLALVDGALGLTQSYLASSVGGRIVLSLRTRLFDHMQQMPVAFFARAQTGALVNRLDNDVSGARTAFTDILSNVIGNLVSIALILAAMFALSWRITAAALVLLPLFILPARKWGRKLQEIARENSDLHAAMNSLMIERFNVAGAQLAKLFGRRDEDRNAFAAKAARVSEIGVRRAVYGRLFLTSMLLMASLATAFAYGWGGVLAVEHTLDVGTVVALASYLVRLYGPLMGLSNMQVSYMTALVSFERVFELLDMEPMIRESPAAVGLPTGPARIEFDHVSFRYPAASEVSLASLEAIAVKQKVEAPRIILDDVSFAAEPGKLVALVGPSGAGKTTVTQLVPRLYDVLSGTVRVNGVDVRLAKLDALRDRIGVVTQDAHLFHDTIRANLLYAKPDATEAKIWEALEAAQIRPLIASLKEGLETVVGERGYRFSGGEKQRIAIARLLLKAPEIVILDEATAHLDSASEAALQQAFKTALAGRTSLVIAHRLSTILDADQILVLEAGRVVQRGRHAELVEQAGLYRELYHKQFAETLSAL